MCSCLWSVTSPRVLFLTVDTKYARKKFFTTVVHQIMSERRKGFSYVVVRVYMSIAVRSNMHFVLYHYCCKGQYSVYLLEMLVKSRGIWSWLGSGDAGYMNPCFVTLLVLCASSPVSAAAKGRCVCRNLRPCINLSQTSQSSNKEKFLRHFTDP